MSVDPAAEQPVRATNSAVDPVYVCLPTGHTGSSIEARSSSSLAALVDSSEATLTPDWSAWAEILAFGAPLCGRTGFDGFRRLQPGEHLALDPGHSRIRQGPWTWADVEPDPQLAPEDLTGSVLDALRTQVNRLAREGPLNPMLSGGRDSRLLAALAAQAPPAEPGPAELEHPELTAWTTSSDTGTSMEELVAARVAKTLGLAHRIVAADHDQFAQDVRDYGRTVDYMASFHIWLMPVARALRSSPGTILDGLGGGVFLGGGFPDDDGLTVDSGTAQISADRILDARFARMGRYLGAADDILAPGVKQQLTDRARADFDVVAEPLAQHPNGATLTAYLTRTLPGISLAPAKVLGSAQPTATPIMADEVITQALRVPHRVKYDGVWYRDLLRRADPRLVELPTAAELTKRRHHVRRGASAAAARWYRGLILNSPVGELLSDRMRAAETTEWSDQLSKTKPQHLIRGLAMLALWLKAYGDRLTEVQPPFTGGADG